MRRFLSFRTKPRNPVRVLEWLDDFATFEGQNYNQTIQKGGETIHPVRRRYVREAHPELDFETTSDPESNARQEKAMYELLGLAYVDDDGTIQITKAGHQFLNSEMSRDELMLRQLLKYQFPNFVNSNKRYSDMRVFLLEALLAIMDEVGAMNRYETALSLMFCDTQQRVGQAIRAVIKFRDRVEDLDMTNKKLMKKTFADVAGTVYPNVDLNKPSSHLTTIDPIFRFLEYTSLFIQSGRSHLTRLKVRPIAREKVDLLRNEYNFNFNSNYDSTDFFDHFGDPHAETLPWDDTERLDRVARGQLIKAARRLDKYSVDNDHELREKIMTLQQQVDEKTGDELKAVEDSVRTLVTNIEETIFRQSRAQTDHEHTAVLKRFGDIIKDRDMDTRQSLWLENNLWRSLVALEGDHYVERNFTVEPDLSPRFYAPGRDNTPDVEYYDDGHVLIVEGTLTTGKQQWANEAASVYDHVGSFIDVQNGYADREQKGRVTQGDDRTILGLFVAPDISDRILRVFFGHGHPSPVVPLNLKQYRNVMETLYDTGATGHQFAAFVEKLHREAARASDRGDWRKRIELAIDNFTPIPTTA